MSSHLERDLPSMITQGVSYIEGNNSLQNIFSDVLNNSTSGPRIDIVESDSKLFVFIEVPGITSSTAKIDFYGNEIAFYGEKMEPQISNGGSNVFVKKREIKYGEIARKFTIPVCVTNSQNVSVNIEDGLCKIIIDKEAELQNRFTINL